MNCLRSHRQSERPARSCWNNESLWPSSPEEIARKAQAEHPLIPVFVIPATVAAATVAANVSYKCLVDC